MAWTLRQPSPLIFAIFTCLGLGMASPYIVMPLFPATLKLLPRPGNWLIHFERFMGFALLVSSLRNKGISQLVTKYKTFSPSQSIGQTKVRRSFWIILLTAFYFFVLLGRIPFEALVAAATPAA